MHRYVVIRSNRHARVGTWLLADEPGDTLYVARMGQKKGRTYLERTLQCYTFAMLAPYIVEHGFEVPMELLTQHSAQAQQDEIDNFQREVEDVVDEELRRREQEAEPGHGGIVVPPGYTSSRASQRDDDDSRRGSGE